jgi:F-type H+-transporting ATPase subunit epsilon
LPIQLTIVTPERVVIDEAVESVVIPGVEGEFGVLPAHEPFVSGLKAGVVRYEAGGQICQVVVSAGFAEVTGEHATLLARTAERAEEIDEARAEAAFSRAQEGLRRTDLGPADAARLGAAAARAAARRAAVRH